MEDLRSAVTKSRRRGPHARGPILHCNVFYWIYSDSVVTVIIRFYSFIRFAEQYQKSLSFLGNSLNQIIGGDTDEKRKQCFLPIVAAATVSTKTSSDNLSSFCDLSSEYVFPGFCNGCQRTNGITFCYGCERDPNPQWVFVIWSQANYDKI